MNGLSFLWIKIKSKYNLFQLLWFIVIRLRAPFFLSNHPGNTISECLIYQKIATCHINFLDLCYSIKLVPGSVGV